MNWDEYKIEFQPDGNLRIISIKGTGLTDWQTLIGFLRRTQAKLDYFIDGVPAELPTKIDGSIIDGGGSHLLVIGLDSVVVNCHCHAADEIELEFDPEAIDSEAKANVIFRLMSTAARRLRKPVTLTTSAPDRRELFLYEPGAGEGIRYLRKGKA